MTYSVGMRRAVEIDMILVLLFLFLLLLRRILKLDLVEWIDARETHFSDFAAVRARVHEASGCRERSGENAEVCSG